MPEAACHRPVCAKRNMRVVSVTCIWIWCICETLHRRDILTCRVLNEDDKSFDFTAALHSYFEVLGIDVASVQGLKGLTYLDKSQDPKNPVEKTENRERVTFGESLVDSVYLNAPEYVELDVGTGAHLQAKHSW